MSDETFPGYYRVTDILSAYSGLSGIDPEVVKKAGDRGIRVHNFCELYAADMLFSDIDEDCKPYVYSFIKWFDATIDGVVCLEERFFCEDLKITGKIDMIAVIKGDTKASVIDYKTPRDVKKTWALQLAAYRHLAKDYDIGRSFALKLPWDGGDALVVEDEHPETSFQLYKGILEAYRYFYPK